MEQFRYTITELFPPQGVDFTDREKLREARPEPFTFIPHPQVVLDNVLSRYRTDGTIERVDPDGGATYVSTLPQPEDLQYYTSSDLTNLRDTIAHEIFLHCKAAVIDSHDEIGRRFREDVLAKYLSHYRHEPQLLREAAQVATEAIRYGLPSVHGITKLLVERSFK